MVVSVGARPARVPALTKYDVLEELGHGGMATVYRAHDKRLGRDVAIKILHPHLRDSREMAHRFEAEAKAVAKLRHRNIVEVFDVSSVDDEEQYLVVEFVRGQTLRKLLTTGGRLPPEVAAALAVELLGALAHAHAAGVVHRDVKPENVMLEHQNVETAPAAASPSSASALAVAAPSRRTPLDSNRGERVGVKLTDFGIAKLLDTQGVTSTGQVLGSPAHMAPEQIEGGDVDSRADVFGLGVLLYECMVGHLPFEGNNPAQVLRRVLDGVYPSAEREAPPVGKVYSRILDRALARKACERYASAEEMREALSSELLRLGIAAPRTELESYFDDPAGWTEDHDKRLVERLCALGDEGRKRVDAVASAADYNRALAYAPDDPHLLRIVTRIHRAEARMRLARRAAPVLFGATALGAGALLVLRAFAAPPVVASGAVVLHAAAPSTSREARAEEAHVVAPVLSSTLANESTVAAPGVRRAPGTQLSSDAGTPLSHGRKRNVVIASLQPAFGVTMTIDGVRGADPAPGLTFTLPDQNAHLLSFTCRVERSGEELCVPTTIAIAAGESEESLDVQVTVRPARLLIEGDPLRSYTVEEANLTLAAGLATEIPMRRGTWTVHIYDRVDPEKRKTHQLVAGQLHVVSFKGP